MKIIKYFLLLFFLALPHMLFATSLRVGFANHTKDLFAYTIESNKAYDPSTTQTGIITSFNKKPVSVKFSDDDPQDIISLPIKIINKKTGGTIYSAKFSLPPDAKAQPQLYDEYKSSDYSIHDASIRFYDDAQIGISIFPKGTKNKGVFI